MLLFLPAMVFGSESNASFVLQEHLVKDGQFIETVCLLTKNTMHEARIILLLTSCVVNLCHASACGVGGFHLVKFLKMMSTQAPMLLLVSLHSAFP